VSVRLTPDGVLGEVLRESVRNTAEKDNYRINSPTGLRSVGDASKTTGPGTLVHMHVLRKTAWIPGAAAVLFLVASCDDPYVPALELWPSSDASLSRAGGGVVAVPGDDAMASGQDAGGVSTGGMEGGEAGGIGDDASTSDSSATGDDAESGGAPVWSSDAGTGGGCLSVTVTMSDLPGGYSPENVEAIWIAQKSGTFVKTLAVWARARMSHLTLWGSATSAAGLSRNTVDAITGASLSSHQSHTVFWNCKDTKEVLVPDGAYRVYFEETNDNRSGPNGFVDFVKSPKPFTLSPPDQTVFTSIHLIFAP
jgi:hypothetical protein